MAIKTKRFVNSRKSCSCSMPGVWRAVAYCDGIVVVFHSPRACAHVARTMDINSHYRTLASGRQEERASVPLLSTQMQEKDSIFGGLDRLTQCLEFAVAEYKPQCLVIANSCVAGVIGDDVDSAAREIESTHGIPVLTVDCCGFLDGEYYEGYFEITQQLLDRFVKPCKKIPDSVLLLGDNGGPWGQYAVEVTRVLHEFGVQVIGQFPGYMSFNELPKVGLAETVIVMGGRGQTHVGLNKIALQLQERFGMRYLPDIYPVGWKETENWIKSMGTLMQREQQAMQVLKLERERLQSRLQRYLPVTAGKKTVLCIGRLIKYFHPGAILQTINLLKLDLQGIIILDAYMGGEQQEMLQVVKECSSVPTYNTADGEELLLQSDLVLTTHELQNKDIKQIFLPMLPIIGVAGELEMMDGIYRCLCSHLKGGMRYV